MQNVLAIQDDKEYEDLVKAFQAQLVSEERGLALLITPEEIQLVTKPQFGDLLLSFLKEELHEELTPATLEALSLIAYGGPISRARLDFLRGVNSTFTLRTLRVRGLVERIPDPLMPHSFLYDITQECLRHLGASSREALPRYAEFKVHLDAAAAKPPEDPAPLPPHA